MPKKVFPLPKRVCLLSKNVCPRSQGICHLSLQIDPIGYWVVLFFQCVPNRLLLKDPGGSTGYQKFGMRANIYVISHTCSCRKFTHKFSTNSFKFQNKFCHIFNDSTKFNKDFWHRKGQVMFGKTFCVCFSCAASLHFAPVEERKFIAISPKQLRFIKFWGNMYFWHCLLNLVDIALCEQLGDIFCLFKSFPRKLDKSWKACLHKQRSRIW